MKNFETWQWALTQVLASKLSEVHLHPYRIEGEPRVTVRRGFFSNNTEHVTIEFQMVPE